MFDTRCTECEFSLSYPSGDKKCVVMALLKYGKCADVLGGNEAVCIDTAQKRDNG